jgi:hypothetical protein
VSVAPASQKQAPVVSSFWAVVIAQAWPGALVRVFLVMVQYPTSASQPKVAPSPAQSASVWQALVQ